MRLLAMYEVRNTSDSETQASRWFQACLRAVGIAEMGAHRVIGDGMFKSACS
jgi:hypothetical protein